MNSLKNCSGARKAGAGIENVLVKSFLVVATVSLLVSCGADRRDRENAEAAIAYAEKSKAVTDSVSSYMPGLVTETIGGITHNFIRTANVKCKVKDVLQSTKQIEQIVSLSGGYVTQSDLNAEKGYCNSIQVKKDTLLEITNYTSVSNLTLRVPNYELDSVLNRITDMAVFVDFRKVEANDVKLKLYANKLAENRYKQYKERVQKKSDQNNAKLDKTVEAEENALQKQELADNKNVESYDLADQVNYSTVSCVLYQGQNTYTNLVPSAPSVKAYEPTFDQQLAESFQGGLNILKIFVLGLVNSWGLILILVGLGFAIRFFIRFVNRKTSAQH